MKFRVQDKQNQLIENITAHHLVVGVDITQENHVARTVNFSGIALGNPLEFSNDEVGFRCLDRWIRDLLASYKLTQIIVGRQSAGRSSPFARSLSIAPGTLHQPSGPERARSAGIPRYDPSPLSANVYRFVVPDWMS